ncbi:MAG: NAD(+) synthase [candidate division WOR-3 bacterium]|nr:MAG: NAD(+) synthase [candidate division WOR-3 bacterium]
MKDTAKNLHHFVADLKNSLETLKKDGAVIGVSGGVDSATVLKLLEQCLPKENILPLILPDRDSNPRCIRLAEKLCRGYTYKKISITPLLQKLGVYREFGNYFFIPRRVKEKYVKKKYEHYGKNLYLRYLQDDVDAELRKAIGYIRIKNRIRMAIMYHYAEINNYAVIGTVNKTEYLLGLFVPFGDGAADLMPLFNIYKTETCDIARALEIPDEILVQAPSPDLIPGLTDEMILGMSYEKVDEILKMHVEKKGKLPETEETKYVMDVYEHAKNLRDYFFQKGDRLLL